MEVDGKALIERMGRNPDGELESLQARISVLEEVVGKLLDRAVPEEERLEFCDLQWNLTYLKDQP
jgi:hypothetical protein